MKRKTYIYISLLSCAIAIWFAFVPDKSVLQPSTFAPNAMLIKLTNVTALDYHDCDSFPNHEMKVTFYGSRYSDGQNVWDPNSPIILDPMYFDDPSFCGCENFYYQDGYAQVYTREDSYHSWIFQGSMQMSSGNCTMDGSKVTMFTVNCQYLYNPN